MICDEEYPKRVAIDFLMKVHDNFKTFVAEKKLDLNLYTADTDVKYDYIANEIVEWQDPSKKDNLMKLQNELNDVTDIMRQNLNELLKREENLESLMQKSSDLSATSVNFYKQHTVALEVDAKSNPDAECDDFKDGSLQYFLYSEDVGYSHHVCGIYLQGNTVLLIFGVGDDENIANKHVYDICEALDLASPGDL